MLTVRFDVATGHCRASDSITHLGALRPCTTGRAPTAVDQAYGVSTRFDMQNFAGTPCR